MHRPCGRRWSPGTPCRLSVSNPHMKRLVSRWESAQTMQLVVALSSFMCVAFEGRPAAQTVAPAPLQDDVAIATAISGDAEAATLISAILKGLTPSDGRVFVLSRQTRVEWLPQVDGIEFVRLSDGEAVARSSTCGNYWVISAHRLSRNGNLDISTRLRCSASVSSMEFALRDSEWRDTGRRGIGSGWVDGPPPECVACLQRR